MVGPGEVDQDLEPEVKDECNTKYGDVNRVVIYEVPNVDHEEAVRIFVEFKRIESAIKGKIFVNISIFCFGDFIYIYYCFSFFCYIFITRLFISMCCCDLYQ